MNNSYQPIGIVRSPYKEKFAIPRQPNLVKSGTGELHLLPPYNNPDYVRGLEQFSHLWLIFIFHQTQEQGHKPTVRPPRLGGNERIGVFASRSTFRPNPIGLSSVELRDIIHNNNQLILKLGSIDLVDSTPIIDIKPYIPYSDSHPEAIAGYAQISPNAPLTVSWDPKVLADLAQYQAHYPQLINLIEEVIAQDPRPAYKKNHSNKQDYGVKLSDFNIRWQVIENTAIIIKLAKLN